MHGRKINGSSLLVSDGGLADPVRVLWADSEKRSKKFARAILAAKKLYGPMSSEEQIELVKWAHDVPAVMGAKK
jgi:hypothetical protein